jgi:DNA-binding XRE family transcriptional regulator
MAKTSEFAEPIRILRIKQGMNQTDLGKYLGVGQTAVSAWEIGDNTPPAEALVKMGNLASYPDCLFFYEKAGMDPMRVAPMEDALRVCLSFVEGWDPRVHEGLRRSITGVSREERIRVVLDCIANLPGLARAESFEEVAQAFARLVQEVSPSHAKSAEGLACYGPRYQRVNSMKSLAREVMPSKETEEREREKQEREDAYRRMAMRQRMERKGKD